MALAAAPWCADIRRGHRRAPNIKSLKLLTTCRTVGPILIMGLPSDGPSSPCNAPRVLHYVGDDAVDPLGMADSQHVKHFTRHLLSGHHAPREMRPSDRGSGRRRRRRLRTTCPSSERSPTRSGDRKSSTRLGVSNNGMAHLGGKVQACPLLLQNIDHAKALAGVSESRPGLTASPEQ